jgi:hypothetical protein
MAPPANGFSPTAFPRTLIYATAMTCGVFAGLLLQIYLGRFGFDLVSLGHNLIAGKAPQLRAAGPWWGIAGLAFVAGGAAAAALSRFSLPWRRFRILRWVAAAGTVLLLAEIGHAAGVPRGVGAAAQVAASLVALALAALMAMLGAYITTARR